MARYLTKSRFKTATECPRKLFYTGKADYVNKNATDEFLQALAEGGYQVGELAKIQIGGGTEVCSSGHEQQLADTAALMAQENVIIYEGAFRFENFFIRVDILKKTGNQIDLIEVKATSFDGSESNAGESDFVGTKGDILKAWLPYLRDIAFQSWVMQQLFPDSSINNFLMMPDKGRRCTVDQLNQRFKAIRSGKQVEIRVEPGTDAQSIGEPILALVSVDECVQKILGTPLTAPGSTGAFPTLVRQWAHDYANDQSANFELGAQCGKCEFRCDDVTSPLKSGFHECWKYKLGWTDADFAEGTVLDLHNFAGKQKLMAQGLFKLKDITDDVLNTKADPNGLSLGQRQWMQVSNRWAGGGEFYLDKPAMHDAMATWQYPLHFIDFETCTPSVPFFKDDRAYDMVAFQFSHHEMNQQVEIHHAGEFLGTDPGVNPCASFVRALRASVGDQGTVFMWSPHENTTLNKLAERLRWELDHGQAPADADELISFIETLVYRKNDKHRGSRFMVDLCNLAKRHFFHPLTKGSSSIKQVLPAVLESSTFLQDLYSQSGYQGRNFADKRWFERDEHGRVLSPYKLLDPLYNDIDSDALDAMDDGDNEGDITNGGAAATAYVRLQSEPMSDETREAIKAGLLRYCELDTLAMVMIVQAWQAWVNERVNERATKSVEVGADDNK